MVMKKLGPGRHWGRKPGMKHRISARTGGSGEAMVSDFKSGNYSAILAACKCPGEEETEWEKRERGKGRTVVTSQAT